MSRGHRKFQELLDEFLEDPQFAADFLSDALQHEDVETFLMSLRDIVRVHGSIAAIAEQADLSRGTLYNMFSATANPSLRSLLSVLNAVGYDLSVTRRPKQRAARPR